MTFVAAFAQKQGRNWRIIMGLLGILAGIVILTYPISSAVTLAFIGGIWLVDAGHPADRRRVPAATGSHSGLIAQPSSGTASSGRRIRRPLDIVTA